MRAKGTIFSLLLCARAVCVLSADPEGTNTTSSNGPTENAKDPVTEKSSGDQGTSEAPKDTKSGVTEGSPSGDSSDSAADKQNESANTTEASKGPGTAQADNSVGETESTGKSESESSGNSTTGSSTDNATEKPSDKAVSTKGSSDSETGNSKDGTGTTESTDVKTGSSKDIPGATSGSSNSSTTGNPSQDISTGGTGGDASTENPSESTSTKEPAEETGGTSGSASTENPSKSASTEGTRGNASTKNPNESTSTEKPAEETGGTSGNASTENPSKSASTEGTRGNASTENSNASTSTEKPAEEIAVDCSDILRQNNKMNGIYKIRPNGMNESFDVFCDMKTDGGGWTVIQKRGNYPGFKVDDFAKNWEIYKKGFGDLNKEYWLGNEKIYALTNQNSYFLRVDLCDSNENKAYAVYSEFMIGNEDGGYQLSLGSYNGGDANDALSYHNQMKFSTTDRDNDKNPSASCSQLYHGGWWYNNCHHANLNGWNLQGDNNKVNEGITWYEWRGGQNSLAFVQMKIRPRDF